jgi:hypothetical protein
MSIDVSRLRPGQSVVYYEGAEPLARLRSKHPEDPQLAAADAAWRLALEGRVDLGQRRTDKGVAYVAIARRQVDRSPVKSHHQEVAMKRIKAA